MTMLRIGSTELCSTACPPPFSTPTLLSNGLAEERAYDIVLANPPSKARSTPPT
jgi:hypothetical protein